MKRKITLRKRIIMATVCSVTAALVCCGAFFIAQIYTTSKANVITQTNESIDQISISVNTKLTHLENSSLAFLTTPTLRSWNNREVTFSADNYILIGELKSEIESNLMFNTSWLSKYIDAIYLFADDQTIQLATRIPSYHNRIQGQFEEVYTFIEDVEGTSFYTVVEQGGVPNVYMVRRMHDITASRELTLIFWLNLEVLSEDLASHDPNYQYYVLYDNTILLAEDTAIIGTGIDVDESTATTLQSEAAGFDRQGQMEVLRPLSVKPFSIYVSIPIEVVTQPVLQTIFPYIGIVLVFVLVFSLLGAVFANTYTRFIAQLAKGIEAVSNSDFNVQLPQTGDEELVVISTAFNDMTAEIKRLINNVYRSELLLKDADIRLLQSQINPHFLVNTLTTIGTRAMLNGDAETYEMTSSLSKMIDSSLYNTSEHSQFVTLQQELEYVKCYLKLQQIRFADQLKYSIDIADEAVLQMYIPRLCVEPLVENAVVHGVGENPEGGFVEVVAMQIEDSLLIEVIDNGKGFDAKRALSKQTPPDGRGHHIGLANTNKRLQLLFGKEYGITFTCENGKRTTAYIRVPIITEKPDGRQQHDAGTDSRG